jgi:hypothetical protein
VRFAYEAYLRGRAMLAATRMRRDAREKGMHKLSLTAVNAIIHKTRSGRAHRP